MARKAARTGKALKTGTATSRKNKAKKAATAAAVETPVDLPQGETPMTEAAASEDDGAVPENLADEGSTPAALPAPKARAPKADKEPSRRQRRCQAAKTPGTVAWLADAYIEGLAESGRSEGTQRSYRADLAVAITHFGPERMIDSLTIDEVAGYFESDRVMKRRDGRDKDKISIDKTRRVFRLALTWADRLGIIEKAPVPAKTKESAA